MLQFSKVIHLGLSLSLLALTACNETPKNNTPADTSVQQTNVEAEIAAITDVVHHFYKWYSSGMERIDYIDSRGKFSKLDMEKVAAYHAQMMKSGWLSQAYIDNDMAHLKKYEAIWAKDKENGNEGPLSGEDYDRVFCGQDWEPNDYTSGPLTVEVTSAYQAKTRVGASQLELVKENGKWLIARISCE